MGMINVPPRQLYASNDVDFLCQEQCSWAPTEGGQSYEDGSSVVEVMLMGCIGVFKGVVMSYMLAAITTQSNTLKGSRLQKWEHISASILACTSTLVGS